MMKSIFLCLLSFLLSIHLCAQEIPEFRVFLKDKGSSIEMLSTPDEFLSKEAIQRRALQNIPVLLTDLPLAKEYIQILSEMDAEILAHSKWLNYAYVRHANPTQIAALPFVDYIEYPVRHQSFLCGASVRDTFNYGFANGQIAMVNGQDLHQKGFTGTGINIAIIDAGYEGFLQSTAFESLRNEQRLLGSYNFITNDTNVFTGWGSHGASVLSVMAANIPDTMIGSAPNANYWLFTTENVNHEMPIELDHWIMAAEFADSVGVHVINSSLSYRIFDDSQFNYVYADMDGNTTLITRAADIAASKGILVVASAGNDGENPYPYISAPADGDSVLTVGSVTWQGNYALFSSIGPTADGRVKPDVVAQGSPITLVNDQGQVDISFGTSFSSPLIAGLSACLIEAYPSLHSEQIADMIRQSASGFAAPTDTTGYGIPDFQWAYQLGIPDYLVHEQNFTMYPNPAENHVIIDASDTINWSAQVSIFDAFGREVHAEKVVAYDAYRLNLDLPAGWYVIHLKGDLNGVWRIQKR